MLDASSMPQLSVSYTLRTIDGDDRRERWAKSSSGGLRVRSGRLQGEVLRGAKWIGTVEIEPRPSGRSGGRSPNCSDEPLRTAPGCYRPLRSRTTSCLDIFSRCRLHRPSRGACGANSPQPQRSTVLTLCPLPCIGSLARRRLIGCADRKSKALRRAELQSRTRPRSKC